MPDNDTRPPERTPDARPERVSLALHEAAFEHVEPPVLFTYSLAVLRQRAREYADALQGLLPDGPDKTYAIRKFREVAMWATVAVTRHPDGSPRA